MNDPIRLVDEHPSPVARSLLSAGLAEEPPASLLERTLVPLGLGAATTAFAQAAQAGTAGVATGAAATTAPPAAATIASSLYVTTVKWIGIAGVSGGLLVGAVKGLSPPSSEDERPPAVAQPAPATVRDRAPAPEPRPVRGAPEEPALPGLDVPAAPASGAVSPTPNPPFPSRAPRAAADAEASKRSALLAEEAKSIDEAREAVATGDAARALRVLDAHRQNFEKPLLKPEALFLEMRALRARGDQASATQVAEELLRRYPDGPQAAAARAFLRTQER